MEKNLLENIITQLAKELVVISIRTWIIIMQQLLTQDQILNVNKISNFVQIMGIR